MAEWLNALPGEILAARSRIAPHVLHTPLTGALWHSDFELHLKREHLQHTGSLPALPWCFAVAF